MKNHRLKFLFSFLLAASLLGLVFLGTVNLDHDSGNHEICPETAQPQNCAKVGSSSIDLDLFLGLLAQRFSENFKSSLLYALVIFSLIYLLLSHFLAEIRLARSRLFARICPKNRDSLRKFTGWLAMLEAKTQGLS